MDTKIDTLQKKLNERARDRVSLAFRLAVNAFTDTLTRELKELHGYPVERTTLLVAPESVTPDKSGRVLLRLDRVVGYLRDGDRERLLVPELDELALKAETEGLLAKVDSLQGQIDEVREPTGV